MDSSEQAAEQASREVCSDCGEPWPLYGDRRLCWLCLQGAAPGNHGVPDLTMCFGQDGDY